jgi:hypothetical protein
MERPQPPSAEELAELRKAEMKKIMELPRSQKRARLRIRHNGNTRPFSRVRSGVRTGTTSHFREWMAALGIRSALQGMKLDDLADSPQTGRVASTLAIIRVNSRIKSVWDLSQASVEQLLSIPQIGPARLAEIETYLKGRNVPLKWTAA